MGKRFGLDGNSKFTMLSGIAHDPIQRDSTLVIKYLLFADSVSVHTAVPGCSAARADG